jgi:hypothetical protein
MMLLQSYGFCYWLREFLKHDPEGKRFHIVYRTRRADEFTPEAIQTMNAALEESYRRYLKDDASRYTNLFWTRRQRP